jgi:succinate dehydrogenase/fumarate reductase cytochrome b subunit
MRARAGIRHLMWDYSDIPAQSVKDDMFQLSEVKKSSEVLLFGSAGVAAILALYYYTV